MIRRLLGPLLLVLAVFVAASPAARAMDIVRVVSPGGIVAWLVRDTTLPLLSLQFRFRGGTAAEPADLAGVGRFAIDLLDEGAGDLDANAFAQVLEERAISLDISADADSISGGLRVLDVHRDQGADLLRLALTAPRFDATAIERVRARLLAGYAREAEEPRAMLRRTFRHLAIGDHPYTVPLAAEIAGTRAATLEDLRRFVAARLARDNLTVGAVGNIDAAELGALLDRVFGALPANSAPFSVPEALMRTDGPRTVVVPRPLPQVLKMFGAPGIKRADPDWFAAQLVNYVMGGGGFNSRLMTELREKRGLTYGVSTMISVPDHGTLMIGSFSTETARAAEAFALVKVEWRRMAEEGPDAEELENAKAYLTGSFPLSLDSSGSVARLLVGLQYDGLGIDYLARRDALIRGVTLDHARRVARRLFGGPEMLTVIVGAAEGIPGAVVQAAAP
jgi:zinc protease